MTEDRQWYNVGAVKRPAAERDIAASVFADHPERFSDVIGADTGDHDDEFPIGSHTTYSALLTEEEADRFTSARNLRYIEPDRVTPNALEAGYGANMPSIQMQRYIDSEVAAYPTLTGTEYKVAIIDEGNNPAARAVRNVTLTDKAFFTNGQPTDELWSTGRDHGCCTMGLAVPYGGSVVDAFSINEDGSAVDSGIANAITWSITRGARVINMSLTLNGAASVVYDALVAANAADVAIFCAAGNDGQNIARFPGSTSQTMSYVHSVMSIDISMNQKSSFSNWGTFDTGIAPGEMVTTVGGLGQLTATFNGTSAATPIVANLCARIMSSGVNARQASAALKATTRDIGLGAKQGGGLYSMQAALRWLDKEPPIVITRVTRPQNPGLLL